MAKIYVYHARYGCDTGCCGHVVQWDNGEEIEFEFGHPYGADHLQWVKKLVADSLGEEHAADLDWENCNIVDNH